MRCARSNELPLHPTRGSALSGEEPGHPAREVGTWWSSAWLLRGLMDEVGAPEDTQCAVGCALSEGRQERSNIQLAAQLARRVELGNPVVSSTIVHLNRLLGLVSVGFTGITVMQAERVSS
jgi:hypothetical protein